MPKGDQSRRPNIRTRRTKKQSAQRTRTTRRKLARIDYAILHTKSPEFSAFLKRCRDRVVADVPKAGRNRQPILILGEQS